jgi:hypothetical protein
MADIENAILDGIIAVLKDHASDTAYPDTTGLKLIQKGALKDDPEPYMPYALIRKDNTKQSTLEAEYVGGGQRWRHHSQIGCRLTDKNRAEAQRLMGVICDRMQAALVEHRSLYAAISDDGERVLDCSPGPVKKLTREGGGEGEWRQTFGFHLEYITEK